MHRRCLRTGATIAALTLRAAVMGPSTASAAGPPYMKGPPCAASSYNKATKMCETQPTITCAAGFHYNSYYRHCVGPYACPDGTFFDNHMCRTIDPAQTVEPTCPLGGTYMGHLENCDGGSAVVTCPEGFTLTERPSDPGGYYSEQICSGKHLRGRSGGH